MELFATASHDRNPLHVSAEYARRTPFAEPVVFGVLGALAAFARLRDRPGAEPSSLRLEFRAPLFVGTSYTVVAHDGDEDRACIRIEDLDRAALEADVVFRAAEASIAMRAAAAKPRVDPAKWSLEDLEPGVVVRGTYCPSLLHLDRLLERWSLPRKGISASAVTALLWASYLVGMELPGERATLWRAALEFPDRRQIKAADALLFEAMVSRRDERVGLVEIEASLSADDAPLAAASIASFVRPEPPRANREAIERLLTRAPRLDGRTAVVVGGSRGLGAALTQALAFQGAHVILVYRQSATEAERMCETLASASGSVEPIHGDAADPRWCRDVLGPVVAAHGGLDLLIANASPPIRTVPLTPAGIGRFDSFVGEALRLAAAPLAALAGEIAARSGTVVFISSSALRAPPPEWPHYVTAKAALEGLASWTAACYPNVRVLVVRPPKLLTDQMNTLLGRVGAAGVEPTAAAIVCRLGEPATGAGVELFEFADERPPE